MELLIQMASDIIYPHCVIMWEIESQVGCLRPSLLFRDQTRWPLDMHKMYIGIYVSKLRRDKYRLMRKRDHQDSSQEIFQHPSEVRLYQP
jgi:hypothetical protein